MITGADAGDDLPLEVLGACAAEDWLRAIKQCALQFVDDEPQRAVSLIVAELPKHPGYPQTRDLSLEFARALIEVVPEGAEAVRAWIDALNPAPAPWMSALQPVHGTWI